MLKFSTRNMKMMHLKKYTGLNVVSFDLPAGHTCPFADICLSKADKETGIITRGAHCKFLCYAVKAEAMYKNTRRMRWHNYDTLRRLRTAESMADEILQFMPNRTDIVRIHSAGEFYNRVYFNAWRFVAGELPHVTFFGYTKGLPYVLAHKPDNFILQYSHGGKCDNEASKANVPTCYVRTNPTQYVGIKTVCADKGAGHEDFYAILNRESFAIGLH